MLSSSRPLTSVPNNHVNNRKLVPTVQSNTNPSLNQRFLGNFQLQPTHISASRGITNTAYSNTELGVLSPSLHLQDVALTDFAFMHPTGGGNGDVNTGTHHGTIAPFIRSAVVVEAPYTLEVSTVKPTQPFDQISVVVSEQHRPSKTTFPSSISPTVQPVFQLPMGTSHMVSNSSASNKTSSNSSIGTVQTISSSPDGTTHSVVILSATTSQKTAITTTPAATTNKPEAKTNTPVSTTKVPASSTIKPVSTSNTLAATTQAPASTTNKLVSTTYTQVATTNAPESPTKVPTSTTKIPTSITKSPAAATKSPAFTTKIPTSITKEPAATIKEPVATTNVSSSTLEIPASTTKAPAATTKSPAFTTNKTVSANNTPAATNNAPATTTKTPASKTKMSASITKAPVATTKVPSATTKVPSSTTKIPASTTKAPASKTKMSASTTKAPVATTKVPSATTKVPSSTTKIPTSITNTPAATSKSPAAANKSPAFTTKIPTSIAKAPAATTKEPVATTNVSSSTLKIPASTTKAPAATTKSPAFTTNKTVSANNTPAATNNAPATTTKTPASKTKMSASTTKAPVATTKVPSSTTKIPASTTKAPAAKTKAPAATTQTTHSSMTTSQAFTSTSPAVKGGVTTAPSSTFSPDIIGGSRTVTIPTTVSLSTNTIPIEASANHGSTNVNIEHFNSPMIVVPEKVRPSVLPDAVSSLDATSKATVTPLNQLSSIPTNQVIATGIGGTSYEVLTSKPTSSPSKRVEQGYKLHGGLHKILNISNTDKSTLSYSNNPTAMDVKSIPVDVNNMPQITTLNTNSVSKEAQNPMHAYPLLSRSANATLITKNEIQHISNSQKGTTAEKDNLTYPKQTKTANVRRQNDGNNKTRTTNPFAALDEKAVDSIASRILTSLVKMVGRQTANDIHQNSINDKNSFTENNDKTTKLERKDQLSAEITRRLSTSLEQLSLNGKLNLESPSPQVMPVVKNIDALNNSVPQKTKKPRIPTPTQMSTHQETTTIQQPPIQPVKHMQENRFSAATHSVTISNEVLPKLATQPSSQQLPVKTEQNPGNQQDMRAPKKATVLLDATETAPASATMTLSSQGLETHTPVAHLSKLNLQDRSNRGKAHHTPLPEVSAGGLNLDLASLLRLTTTTTASQKPTESSTISTNSVANKDISTQLSIKSTVASPLIANSRKSIGGSRLATVSQSSSNHHTAVSSAATKQLPSAKPVDPSIVPLKSTVQTSKSSPEVRIADNISYKHSVLAVTTTVSSVTGESLSKKLIVNLNDLINTSHPIAKDNYTSKITARQKLDISDLKANTFESLPLHSTVVKTTSTPSTRQDMGVTASTMPINLIKKSTAAPPLLATKSPQSVMQPSTSPSAIIASTTTGPIFHKHEDIKSKTEGSHSSVSTTTSRPFPRNAGQKTAATIPDNGRPIPNATDKGQSSKLAPSVVKIQTQENKSPGIGHDTTTPRSNIKEWEFAAISAGILKTTPSTNHEWLPHSFPVIPEVPKGLEFLSLQPRKERTSSNSLLRKLVLNSFKPEKQMQISKEGLLLSENSVITNNVVQPNKNVDLKQDLVTQHSNGMYSSKIRPTKSSIVQSNLQDPQLIQQLVYSRVNQSAARQVSPTSVSNVGYSLSESTNHLQSDHTDGTSHTLGRFNTKDLVNGISSNADMFKVLKNAVTKQDRMPGKTGTGNAETSLKQTKTVDNPAYKVNQIMYPRDISVPALEMIVDVPHGRLNPVKPTKPSHAEQVI
ncbi:uncharacterized protein [Argopecten irradians]|uniref:uncharacterized protein n=1 Tax=Argopecten irradians TaxID=31199 RepID=UPI00371462C9